MLQSFDFFKIDGIHQITVKDAAPFILQLHYAKRMPSISYAFGLFSNGEIIGVVCFGTPASNPLCRGICGEIHAGKVLELNRLVLLYNRKNEASKLVGGAIKKLPKPKIIVSYADTAQNHIGYVYQATNFLFTGTTAARSDMAAINGKHPRHHAGDRENRVPRSPKHRYVFFHANKKEKRILKESLRYPIIHDYPKREKKQDNEVSHRCA